jgi:hypothetical protein
MSVKKYYPAPHIRYCWLDDRIMILDLHSESYFALDPLASAMWHDLIGENSRKRSENYPPESTGSIDLKVDFASFTQKCLTESFITETQAPSLRSIKAPGEGFQARRFLTIRAWWNLWRVTRSLSQLGFSKTYNAALHLPKFENLETDEQSARLSAALRAFARAENFFHLKKAPQDCLPRSLALFRFLHSIGLAVEHRIGLQQFPFLAHAWTEYHGEVLHDDPRNQERFTVIAKIPA